MYAMSSLVLRIGLKCSRRRSAAALPIGFLLKCNRCTDTTMQDVKQSLLEHMGLKRGFHARHDDRTHLLQLLPKAQDELPARRMQDSFTSAIIPLSRDVLLQEKYVTFLGRLRVGRLMEDMDLFAVYVAHTHISNPKQEVGQPTPYVLVTVLVDQIDFTDYVPKHDADVRLSGHVSWVGKSSIEVTVWLEQQTFDTWERITTALFLLAARNSTNTGAAVVNRLQADRDSDVDILQKAEERRKRRLQLQDMSLLKQLPDATEQQIIHDIFVDTVDLNDAAYHHRILPPNSQWMSDCKLSNIVFSHPEDRNMHNKVFGGFLMRQALELSWATGYMYSHYQPYLCHISDIGFHKPVDVGSLLRMHAYVTYTEQNYMQILVQAEVFNTHGEHTTTNKFHYTYRMPQPVPKVIPQSYQEAMLYLDGRRHFRHVGGLDVQ